MLTGVLFVAALVGAIVFGPLTFVALFALITGLALWEYASVLNEHAEASVNRLITTLAGVYLFLAFAAYTSGYQGAEVFIPYLVTIIYLPIAELYLHNPDPLKNWAYAFAGQLYVALPFSMLCVLGFIGTDAASAPIVPYNYLLPLCIFIFLWTNDTGAYCCGSLLHKRFPAKLFERISPNKSWVGSIGGAVLCLLVAVVLNYIFPDQMKLLQWMGFALTVCVFGTWGDLVESHLKRHLGIKDSGNILPGHGGMLDRFDSSLLAIPATVVYFYTLNMF